MVFKLNISDRGKAWKVESESEFFVGKSLGDKIQGKEIKPELEGYEFEISGGSDLAGFPLSKDVPGLALKSLLLTKGFGMRDNTEGVRRRKTVRGKTISASVSLINLKVVKSGAKKFEEIFPEQNKPKEKKTAAPAPAPTA
jgi:small subunit ribosomal protein S6e